MIPEDLVPADCPWPIVLGVDPGTVQCGFGALVVAPEGPRLVTGGVFAPARRLPVPQRLASIQGELEELLARLRPGVVVVEPAFAARNVRSALRIGEARGMVLATAARAGASIHEYAPSVAKKAVIGHGAGSKEQVAAMVRTLLGVEELEVPLDTTDALALALAYVHRSRLEALTTRTRRS